MSTQYPNGIDNFPLHQDNAEEIIAASHINNLQDAVTALEQQLGYGDSRPTSSATPNTIAKRDAEGHLAANSFDGQLNGYNTSQSADPNTVAVRDQNGNVQQKNVLGSINPNLLFNPTGRGGLNGWTPPSGTPATYIARMGTAGEGGYFLATTSSSLSAGTSLKSTNIPAGAGQTYTVSGELYTSGQTSGTASIELRALDSSNNDLGVVATAQTTNGKSWTFVSASGTTPSGTSYLQVRLVLSAGSSTTNTGWRRIKVEIGSLATTFVDDNTLNVIQYAQQLFPSQFSTNGYQQLPNGFILQWLEYTPSSPANLSQGTHNQWTVSWPIKFPNACLSHDGCQVYGNTSNGAITTTFEGADQNGVTIVSIYYGNSQTTNNLKFRIWAVGY
jgi:hypothetical protein